MFCKESLGKIKFRAFPERVGPGILSLESIEYFRPSENFSGVEKKKNNLNLQNLDHDGSCKLSLYTNKSCDEHGGLFSAMIDEMTPHVLIMFFVSGNDVISLESRPLGP